LNGDRQGLIDETTHLAFDHQHRIDSIDLYKGTLVYTDIKNYQWPDTRILSVRSPQRQVGF